MVRKVLVIEVFVAAFDKKCEINVEIRFVFCYKSNARSVSKPLSSKGLRAI